MTIQFEAPTGAPADVAELEYIAALQQTQPGLIHRDGRVTATDVCHHLMSRHGINITPAVAQRDILNDLAGYCTDKDSDDVVNTEPANAISTEEEVDIELFAESLVVMNDQNSAASMDLVQQVALLVIPELLDTAEAGIVDGVLRIVLDHAGVEYGVELTNEVLSKILDAYGEDWSDETHQQMLQLCHDDTEVPILDGETFRRALTADIVEKFPSGDQSSTHYQDALRLEGQQLARVFTAPAVDYTADTHRSVWWAVLSWVVLVLIFFAYFVDGYSKLRRGLPSLDCESSSLAAFGCSTVKGVVAWLEIFFQLSVVGTSFLFLTTLGNSIYAEHDGWLGVLANCTGIVTVVFFTILAFKYSVDTPIFSSVKNEGTGGKYYAALVTGCMLLVTQLVQLIRLIVPISARFRPYFASGGVKLERLTKQAASCKVQNMLKNALDCFLPSDHSGGIENSTAAIKSQHINASIVVNGNVEQRSMSKALLKFNARLDETERVGGVLWAWRKILWGRSLLRCEGICLFPRLVASNVAQWFVCCMIPVIWVFFVAWMRANFATSDGIQIREIQVGIAMGGMSAFLAAGAIAVVYIPSSVSTILQFRSGCLGSLKDETFQLYRVAPDQATLLFGSAFWGIIFTALVTWCVVGVIFFLLAWPDAREIMLIVIANVIGICITIAVKMLILTLLRNSWYSGLYRKQPAPANILNVVLECWNLGLSTGYIIARTSKILLVAVLYIGRIDVPFLAPGVGWVMNKVPLDGYPIAFRKDLLLHEAHRHPYLERLALLFLLKLRHGNQFANRAGAAWRILFVLALMPWMRKYRHTERRKAGALCDSSVTPQLSAGELYTDNQTLLMEVEELRRRNQHLMRIIQMQHSSQRQSRRRTWMTASD